ncbi:uncharacterized protein I206_101047 [Kwoniella pini CBS 10737]|uniref:Velvet domain-containing protein n=1 Tax=Kwoniella pini CBS 10737 TaxID=1296096 RepID=A0A1B9IBG2_9TREE|nr:uncharacterized protein I206_00279 [Kwoniella pini CBS 10737]OCF52978.1 hypothetical protein I206_00279 [Kwoniella pini CBS 10737]
MTDSQSVLDSNLLEIDYITYRIRLESEPPTTWISGNTLGTKLRGYVFTNPLKIIIDANTIEFPACPQDNRRLTVNLSLLAAPNTQAISFSLCVSVPLLGVEVEQRDGRWIGTSVINGFLSDLIPGMYVLQIEVLDMDGIYGTDLADAIVATYLSDPINIL